nr:hypothetical protein [Delftia acidovorans]
MKLQYLALLIATTLLAGCATTDQSRNSTNQAQQPKRERDASDAIPIFTGNYTVTDSRRNRLKITSANLSVEDNIPVMRLKNAEGKAVLVMDANECAGDIKNKFSGMAYLYCAGKKPSYGGMPNIFSVSERKAGHAQKTGTSLFPDEMILKDGLLITIFLEGESALPGYLSVRREP